MPTNYATYTQLQGYSCRAESQVYYCNLIEKLACFCRGVSQVYNSGDSLEILLALVK